MRRSGAELCVAAALITVVLAVVMVTVLFARSARGFELTINAPECAPGTALFWYPATQQLQCAAPAVAWNLDVDGNGKVDALTDGILVLRYLFGLRGAELLIDAVGAGATRITAVEIEHYLAAVLPH